MQLQMVLVGIFTCHVSDWRVFFVSHHWNVCVLDAPILQCSVCRWIRPHPLTSIACSVVQQGWRWSCSWLSVGKVSRGIRTGITYCFPLPNIICISWILICNCWKSLSESSYLVVLIGLIPSLKFFLCFSWIAGRNAKSTRLLSGFICPDIWGLGTCWWASAYGSSDSCRRVHQDKW